MLKPTTSSMRTAVITFSFIAGVVLTVFIYQAVTIYQLRSVVAEDHVTITNVVNFLNEQIQAANPQAKAQAPKATANDEE